MKRLAFAYAHELATAFAFATVVACAAIGLCAGGHPAIFWLLEARAFYLSSVALSAIGVPVFIASQLGSAGSCEGRRYERGLQRRSLPASLGRYARSEIAQFCRTSSPITARFMASLIMLNSHWT